MNANDVANRNLQHRVRMMANNSEGYIEIRQRFLEQNNDTESSSPHGIIRVGNAAAHEGDAVTDPGIYLSGQRTDRAVFIALYGVLPGTLSEHKDNKRRKVV